MFNLHMELLILIFTEYTKKKNIELFFSSNIQAKLQ